MAKHVIKNPDVSLTIGGTEYDLADHIRSISFTRVAGEVDATAFGDDNIERIAGLFDGSVDIDWHADFAASSVFDVLKDALATKITLKVDPTSGTVQDEGEVEVLVTELPLFDGAIGELSMFSTSWPFSGDATFTQPPPTPLYVGKLIVGEADTDKSGFNRHSSPATHFGQLDEQRPTGIAATPSQQTRIIALYQDVSDDELFIRTNRRQDLEGKWLQVDDEYVQMDGFDSSGDLTIDLGSTPDSTTWSGNAWTLGSFLPVAVYDREPAGSAALATPSAERLGRLGMTIATDGNERGFHHASGSFQFGGPTDPSNRQVSLPDGTVTVAKCAYDTSGGGEWDIQMATQAQGTDCKELWVRVVHQVGSGTLTEIMKGRCSGATSGKLNYYTAQGETPSAPDPIATWNANTTDWFLEFWLGEPS